MKKWFQNLGSKMQSFMYGRYGYDELSRTVSILAVILAVLSLAPDLRFLSLFAFAAWTWILIRSFSKNLSKRQQERNVYLQVHGRITGWFDMKKRAWADRKTHCYFTCPNCKRTMRVPKGKGKIKITCPQCRHQITKKT